MEINLKKKSLLIAISIFIIATFLSFMAFQGKIEAAGHTTVDLLAGQDMKVGTVTVTNTATEILVAFKITEPGWCISETHVHVGENIEDFPLQGKQKNPAPGQFDYKMKHDPFVTEYTYTIPNDWASEKLIIAAHAVVLGGLTTMNIKSGLDTDVTAINGTQVTVPQKAVAALEPGVGVSYPNCPAGDNDAIASLWDKNAKLKGGALPNWMGADWIWSSIKPAFPKEGEYVDFAASFDIPGTPKGGTLIITADNAYSASLNGNSIGSSISLGPGFPGTLMENVGLGNQVGSWGVASQGWQLVNQWTLTDLTEGSNVLTITAANEYMYPDDSYLGWNNSSQTYITGSNNKDPDGSYRCINPAGLIFRASVDYYSLSETAWGAGTRFTEKGNWATWFDYTVK